MPKAKKKSHSCQTHEECRQWVCFICLKKSDGNGLSKSMEDFIVHQGICRDFHILKPYLPVGSCGSCRTYVSRFLKNGTPVKTQSSDDYLSIADELRNLPIGTRNPKSKLECRCRICQIARFRFPFAKKNQYSKFFFIACSSRDGKKVFKLYVIGWERS